MLGLTGELESAVVDEETLWIGRYRTRVIVCAPGEPVQVVVMELVENKEARAA